MTVKELWERAELDEEARQVAPPETPARTYVEALARAGRVREAIAALAQLLPRHDAIAWGLESIRRIGPPAALKSVEDWLAEPTEERRRAAMQAAGTAGYATAGGCLALAVFLSGGSVAPVGAPVEPQPAPNLCGKMVACAMALAAAADPQHASGHLRSFQDRGWAVANERNVWEEK
jgi:hypothetical protein